MGVVVLVAIDHVHGWTAGVVIGLGVLVLLFRANDQRAMARGTRAGLRQLLGGVLEDRAAELWPERLWAVVAHVLDEEEAGVWDEGGCAFAAAGGD